MSIRTIPYELLERKVCEKPAAVPVVLSPRELFLQVGLHGAEHQPQVDVVIDGYIYTLKKYEDKDAAIQGYHHYNQLLEQGATVVINGRANADIVEKLK